jgi:hypothetical protein
MRLKMKNTFKYLPIIISLFVLSCQEVVTIDLEEGQKRLVVEGRVSLYKEQDVSMQEIRLSTTADYFSNEAAPPATGAEVSISGSDGQLVQLSEQEPGIYRSVELNPVVGEVYELIIIYGSETYRGKETMIAVAPIDTMYQEFIEENLFDDAGLRLKIDYQDPVQEINYYYWEQFRNGSTFIEPNPGTKWSLVSSDELYNGQFIRGRLVNDEIIYEPGQVGLIRQIGISEQAYRYYFTLFDQEGSRGNLSAPPAPIRGNIENITNPDNYPLGYFYASEISERELIIE